LIEPATAVTNIESLARREAFGREDPDAREMTRMDIRREMS